MENMHSNEEPSGSNKNQTTNTKTGLTPRELIHYHMNNPDEPIKDEDMENLVLDTRMPDGLVDTTAGAADNRMLDEEEIKKIQDNSITTPYDILGG